MTHWDGIVNVLGTALEEVHLEQFFFCCCKQFSPMKIINLDIQVILFPSSLSQGSNTGTQRNMLARCLLSFDRILKNGTRFRRGMGVPTAKCSYEWVYQNFTHCLEHSFLSKAVAVFQYTHTDVKLGLVSCLQKKKELPFLSSYFKIKKGSSVANIIVHDN